MQVASIFLHPGRTSPAWPVASTPPIKKGSGPARPGLPQDSHKTPNFPGSTGFTVSPGRGVEKGRQGPLLAGVDKERVVARPLIAGVGRPAPRLFPRAFPGSYLSDRDRRPACLGRW